MTMPPKNDVAKETLRNISKTKQNGKKMDFMAETVDKKWFKNGFYG